MNRTFVLLMVLCVAGGLLHLRNQLRGEPPRDEHPAPVPAAAVMPVVASGRAVDVYGRTSCGYTRQMIERLQAASVPMRFHDIDHAEVNRAFHKRFSGAGMETSRGYALPVVAVAGQRLARPDPATVIYAFRNP